MREEEITRSATSVRWADRPSDLTCKSNPLIKKVPFFLFCATSLSFDFLTITCQSAQSTNEWILALLLFSALLSQPSKSTRTGRLHIYRKLNFSKMYLTNLLDNIFCQMANSGRNQRKCSVQVHTHTRTQRIPTYHIGIYIRTYVRACQLDRGQGKLCVKFDVKTGIFANLKFRFNFIHLIIGVKVNTCITYQRHTSTYVQTHSIIWKRQSDRTAAKQT